MIYTYTPLTSRVFSRWFLFNLGLNTFFSIYFWIAFKDDYFGHFLYSQINGTTIVLFGTAASVLTRNASPSVRIWTIYLFSLAGCAAGVLMAFVLLRFPSFIYQLFMFSFVINSLIASFVVGFLYYWERIGQTQARIRQEQLKQLDIEKSIVQARLKLIQTRLDPEFLFKILDKILELLDSDLETAKSMQLALIQYLRLSLSGFKSESTTVDREMAIIEAYLKIFKLFPGMELNYNIDVTDDLRNQPIPPMLIQSLVDKLVTHRCMSGDSRPRIRIRGDLQDGRIGFYVADMAGSANRNSDFPGLLEPIRRRVDELFGAKGNLVIENSETNHRGISAAIMIPVLQG